MAKKRVIIACGNGVASVAFYSEYRVFLDVNMLHNAHMA